MTDLSGKVAVVVGASGERSFGETIARMFARHGAKVVVSARRIEPLRALAQEIGGLAVGCDISDDAQLEALARAALERFGRIDIAVNSSGVLAWGPIAKLRPEDILPTLNVSVMGSLLFFKHMGNAIARSGGGSVVTISSQTAQIPSPGYAVYATARAGIDFAMRVAACEYGPRKVRFNSIAAGLVRTDMTEDLFQIPDLENAFVTATPLRRMGSPEDVARVALWLADDAGSGFVTGEQISVSGGGQHGRLVDHPALSAMFQQALGDEASDAPSASSDPS